MSTISHLWTQKNMDYIFLTGLFGSLVLVAGAAWPEGKAQTHPAKSTKNWLFAIGGLIMLLYSIFGYQTGGPIFYVFLELLVCLASLLMMLNVRDSIDTPIIIAGAVALIAWSLYLSVGYVTIIFIVGLAGIGLGYALQNGTMKRMLCLTLGSAFIALFSYLEASWIFFWLNVFFSLFSAYYLIKFFR